MGSRDIDMRCPHPADHLRRKVVLRLLDKSNVILEIERLTPFPETLEVLKKV